MESNKLATDTALQPAAAANPDTRSFTSTLHPDWQVWFPNGGYLGAIAMRAASKCTHFDQPRSFACHFLSVPQIGEIEINVTVLRQTKFATSLSTQMFQQGKPVLQAITWFGGAVPGYDHNNNTMPSVPSPDDCQATTEIEGGHATHPFWNNIEQRPVTGRLHWQLTAPEAPQQRDWIRFLPDVKTGHVALDMMRYIVLLDTYAWPAAARAHAGDGTFIAPTLALNVEFHKHHSNGWLLSDANVPTAHDGYMSALNRLWSERGDLLATATATLMCRPRPA